MVTISYGASDNETNLKRKSFLLLDLLMQRLTALAFLPVDRVVSTYAVMLASAVRTQGYLFGNDALVEAFQLL
jgi:hypothetical protein